MQFRPVLTKIQLLPRPQKLLSRPRLLDFLSDHAGARLTAISAAAGYGKTSLLVDYAHRAEVPVCWYMLDRFDRDPGVFFAHLVASVRQQFPDFGQQSEAALASLQNPARDWPALAAATINELYETIPDYFTIVLDDYHHVEDVVSINDFLAYLLQYSDEHCHLIIASRRLPRLPNQALLLGRGQMVGLDTEEMKAGGGSHLYGSRFLFPINPILIGSNEVQSNEFTAAWYVVGNGLVSCCVVY